MVGLGRIRDQRGPDTTHLEVTVSFRISDGSDVVSRVLRDPVRIPKVPVVSGPETEEDLGLQKK